MLTDSQFATPVLGSSGLSDAERAAVIRMAVAVVAAAEDLPPEDAADVLDRAAETGHAHLAGDDRSVALTLDGEVLLAVDRDELRAAVAAG